MVDVDPVGAFTSQIFSEFFLLSSGSTTYLTATSAKRAFSWVNWYRNLQRAGDSGASATWQIALPAADLSFATDQLTASPALQALSDAAQAGQGLLIRFCTYIIGVGLAPQEIDPTKPNPRRMVLVGTIGGWGANEPAATPIGRLLYPVPDQPLAIPGSVNSGRGDARYWLAPAVAQVQSERKVITLDLISSMPEATWLDITNHSPDNAPEKFDMGTLSLCLRSGNGKETVIGEIPFDGYNKSAYFARAGIVDIPYDDQIAPLLGSGDLLLMQEDSTDANRTTLLSEMNLAVVTEPEFRGIYLEAGESRQVTIQVLHKGQMPQGSVTVKLTQVNYPQIVLEPSQAFTQPDQRAAPRTVTAASEDGNLVLAIPATLDVTNGAATFTIKANQAGISKIVFETEDDPPINLDPNKDINAYFLQWLLRFFINVRVLPHEDYSDKDDDFLLSEEGWKFMYRTVFQFFDVLYPVMSQIIDFCDPAAVYNAASNLKAFTDTANFEKTTFMPITRDLPPGRRRLLARWATLVETQKPTPPNKKCTEFS